MNLAQKLAENPVFSVFSSEELQVLSTFMEEATYGENEVIFDEQSPTKAVYIVLSGRINIFKQLHGMTNFLTILDRNDVFGEVAFVDQQARSASARALDDCTLAKFAYEHFDVIQRQAPQVGMKFILQLMKELSRKFRALNAGLDLKSLEHTVNELILSKQQVKVSTVDAEYYCNILYFDRGHTSPFMKIDVKGQVVLLPMGQIKSITLQNKFGKF